MKQIEDKTPINANAEYIVFYKDKHNVLVDMNDIDDILPYQDAVFQNTGKKVTIYSIMFKDHSFWQMVLDDKTLNIFKKFKEKIDKSK